MRYHSEKPDIVIPMYGKKHVCSHPVYDVCTLFLIGNLGLAVVQQRFDPKTKHTWWSDIDPWIANALYLNEGFYKYFMEHAAESNNRIYPTVSVRQIMWALKMKPLQRERWETVFDRKDI